LQWRVEQIAAQEHSYLNLLRAVYQEFSSISLFAELPNESSKYDPFILSNDIAPVNHLDGDSMTALSFTL